MAHITTSAPWPRRATRVLRYAWAAPTTAVGLLAAGVALLLGARPQWRQGALEVHGGALAGACRRLPQGRRFAAITLGHVILGLDGDCLNACRAHEQVHVRQAERWGPLFLPAYLAASAWAWARGGDAYRDNVFEREAYAADQPCQASPRAAMPAPAASAPPR